MGPLKLTESSILPKVTQMESDVAKNVSTESLTPELIILATILFSL